MFGPAASVAACALCAVLLGTACSGERPQPTGRAVAPPDSLMWNNVPGAEHYTVRAWSGDRLLFEVTTPDTLLVLTPSLARAVAAFDSSTAEITAERAGGPPAHTWRPLTPGPRRAAVGAGGGT